MSYSSPIVAALHLSNTILTTQEEQLIEKVDQLESKKTQLEIFSKMIHALALAKQSNKELRIEEEEIKKLAIYIHRYDPQIFADWVETFPEGTLIQPLSPSDSSLKAFLDAGCEGLTLSEVEFNPIPHNCIDAISRRLNDAQQIHGTEVTQLVNEMQMLYDTQGQFVDIMRDINKQNESLFESINRHMTR